MIKRGITSMNNRFKRFRSGKTVLIVQDYDIKQKAQAYIDGSFNSQTGIYGWGGFITFDGVEFVIQGSNNNPKYAKSRNIAGEIEGATHVIQFAIDCGIKDLDLYYDYEGIAKWFDGTYVTKKPISKNYKVFADSIKNKINVTFHKVTAHTGVQGNERADKLAKQAVGILAGNNGVASQQ